MFTSLLHYPVLLISHGALHYIEEYEGEKKKRTERDVMDKKMHIRNIENGDFFIQRVSCKNDVTQEGYHVRAVCLSAQKVLYKDLSSSSKAVHESLSQSNLLSTF
jgi:hypothetical protein